MNRNLSRVNTTPSTIDLIVSLIYLGRQLQTMFLYRFEHEVSQTDDVNYLRSKAPTLPLTLQELPNINLSGTYLKQKRIFLKKQIEMNKIF